MFDKSNLLECGNGISQQHLLLGKLSLSMELPCSLFGIYFFLVLPVLFLFDTLLKINCYIPEYFGFYKKD